MGDKEDTGLASLYTEPMFDINQMALDSVGLTPREAARQFYGDRTDDIVDQALTIRMKRSGVKGVAVRDVPLASGYAQIQNYNIDKSEDAKEARGRLIKRMESPDDALEETDRRFRGSGLTGIISKGVNRAYATRGTTKAHTAHHKAAAAHERFGHNLNPAGDFKGAEGRDEFDNNNELLMSNLYTLIGQGQRFYTHRNQNELAAAVANLRKSLFKRSGGKVDIAEPGMLAKVRQDYYDHPDTYKGPWITSDSREFLSDDSFEGADLLIPQSGATKERGLEIQKSLDEDADYLKQFVKTNGKDGGAMAADKGGEAAGIETETAVPRSRQSTVRGPRIIINPTTFKNQKDALCVAFNERFRIAMERYGWVPKSEPTDAQRRFFSDTAYADDEEMLRRTIIARIIVLDTSVKDPTDAQLADAMEFLNMFREREKPSNQWEADALERIVRLVETVQPKGEAR